MSTTTGTSTKHSVVSAESGHDSTQTGDINKEDTGLDLNTMNMMLEPQLRPIPPDPTNPESVEIFNEHKKTAQEYLQVNKSL